MNKYILLAVLALAFTAPSFVYAEDAAPAAEKDSKAAAGKHMKREHKKHVKKEHKEHKKHHAAKEKVEAAPAAAPAAEGNK